MNPFVSTAPINPSLFGVPRDPWNFINPNGAAAFSGHMRGLLIASGGVPTVNSGFTFGFGPPFIFPGGAITPFFPLNSGSGTTAQSSPFVFGGNQSTTQGLQQILGGGLGAGAQQPATAGGINPSLLALLGQQGAGQIPQQQTAGGINPSLLALLGQQGAGQIPQQQTAGGIDPNLLALLGQQSTVQAPQQQTAGGIDPSILALLQQGQAAQLPQTSQNFFGQLPTQTLGFNSFMPQQQLGGLGSLGFTSGMMPQQNTFQSTLQALGLGGGGFTQSLFI